MCTEHTLLCLSSFTALFFLFKACIFTGCFSLNTLVWSGRNERQTQGTGQFSAHPFAVHNLRMLSNLHSSEWESFRLGNNSASIWVLHMKKLMYRAIKFLAELHKKFVESSLDLESLRSMPWLTTAPSLTFPVPRTVPPPALLTRLWARRKTNSTKWDASGSLYIFRQVTQQPEQTGVISIAAKSWKSTRELRAADSRKQQCPEGRHKHPLTLQLPVLDGIDLTATHKPTDMKHIEVKPLWHRLNFSCSITLPLNPNGVWYISPLEMSSLCPQTAGQPVLCERADGPLVSTAWPIQWQWMYWLYCPQDSICYIKNK